MQIEQLELSELKPYDRNARTHSEEQIKEIMAAMEEFGFLVPILIDETNTIIAGHCRLECAKRLNYKTVPTIQVSHLTPEQKRAFIVFDNKAPSKAGWDEKLLGEELFSLMQVDYDLKLTGFDEFEIKDLFKKAGLDGFHPQIEGSKELTIDDFNLSHKCPRCGFEFDSKNGSVEESATSGNTEE